MATLTDFGLALAMQHDLEVRPGNEGEIGSSRGFSLHVRGLDHGQILRYDPEASPTLLITWLPAIEPALGATAEQLTDAALGFHPLPPRGGYQRVRADEVQRDLLAAVLKVLIARTQQMAVPELFGDPAAL